MCVGPSELVMMTAVRSVVWSLWVSSAESTDNEQSDFGKDSLLHWSAQCALGGSEGPLCYSEAEQPLNWRLWGGFADRFLQTAVMEFPQGHSQRKKVKMFTSVCSLKFSLFSCQFLC